MTIQQLETNWGQIFQPATENASHAIQQWTDGQIELTLDDVQECPLEELGSMLQDQDSLLTMVIMGIAGSLTGQIILAFDDDNASSLVELLLNRPVGPQEEWGELELSALRETGNILGSAYLNRVTALIGHRLVPSPPNVLRDYGGSVLQQAVMAQALTDDRVLLCQIRVARLGKPVAWNVFFVPSQELLTVLRDTLSTIQTDESDRVIKKAISVALRGSA